MRFFKERVKPGEYIDLDLYGRGDPPIFGPGAHIQTQKEAQRYLEEAQRRKEDRDMNRHAVCMKENEQGASSLLRSTSSAGRAELEKEVEGAPVDNSQEHQETVRHHDGLIPTETIANNDLLGQEIVVNNAATAPLPQNFEEDEIIPNDKELTPAEDEHEEDEIVPADKTPTPAQHELEGGKVVPADLAINDDDAVAPIDEKEEKEANSRKVFSFKLQRLAKKTSSLVKRLSSGRRKTENEDGRVRNSEKREAQNAISHEAGLIPPETKADEQGIVTNDETPVPLAANSEEEDIAPNDEAVAPVEAERDEKVNNGIVDDDATFAPIDAKEEKPRNSPRVSTAPLPQNLEVDEILPNRVPNDKETTPAEDGHEEDEIVPADKTPTPAQHELEGGKVVPADLAINDDDAVAPIDEEEENEANSRKVFSFKLRALAKKASYLVKRLSSGRMETENEDVHVRNSENREAQDTISHDAGLIPAETEADEQGIVANDETPVPLAANNGEEDIILNDEAVAPVEAERDEKVNNGIVDDDATFAPIDDKEEKPTNSPRVFSSKLRALARKASSLVKRMSSGKRPENENGYVSVNDDRGAKEANTSHVGLIPAETRGDDDDIDSNDEAPASPADQHEEEDATANDKTVAYAEAEKNVAVVQKHETEEQAPRLSDRVVDESNNIDHTPRRVMSKLPSEEAPPDAYVQKGHVARAMKALSSLDKEFWLKQLSEQPRVADYSSHPLHGTSSAEVSEPGSAEGADKPSKEGSKKEVHERVLPEAAITNEEEATRGIFVNSNEEFSLSFSTPQKNGGNGNGNGSTSSEEDLRLRVTQREGVPINNAGIYGIGKKRIAGLFRSGDTDSGSDNDGAEIYSQKPGGLSNTPEATIKDPDHKPATGADSATDFKSADLSRRQPHLKTRMSSVEEDADDFDIPVVDGIEAEA